jgi:putative transposase
MIEPFHNSLSITKQCQLIDLPRSSYYRANVACTETSENLELMGMIDEEFMRRPFLGSRKLRDYLWRLGSRINRKRVQRLMRKMGLVSLAPKPNTSLANKKHKVYPYLLRNFIINQPDQVWCTDITYSAPNLPRHY